MKALKIASVNAILHLLLQVLLVRSRADEPILNTTRLDCGVRKLALEFAKSINNDEGAMRHVFDALRLSDLCRVQYDEQEIIASIDRKLRKLDTCSKDKCTYVTSKASGKDVKRDGSIDHPWHSIHEALEFARSTPRLMTIVLREGIHYLNGKTLNLDQRDAGMTIRGYLGEEVWISGGIPLNVDFEEAGNGLFQANVSDLLQGIQIPSLVSLFTTNRRYFRARYPNSNPEIDQW